MTVAMALLAVLATVVVLVVLLGLLVALGWALAVDHHQEQAHRLRQQREALDAEWRALEQTARVRAVFLGARRAMHEESVRQAPRAADEP
ncbi:hypothetical protein BJF78_07360 [Pseudonocardia sp. CNS-139]|nr:hypothetical protein BJF78_07360 [Pseudonocardia sp. CNS-139]